MSISAQVSILRAKFVARLGDIKRAVDILLQAGYVFAIAVRMVLGFARAV